MTVVDVSFPLDGATVPLDHGYALFGALSRILPKLHDQPTWGGLPIRGHRDGSTLKLDRSHLAIRLPAVAIAELIPLMGSQLVVDGHTVAVGAMRVWPLRPAPMVVSRLVVVASVIDVKAPEDQQRTQLTESVKRKLAHLELGMDPERVEVAIGRRHVTRIGAERQHARKSGAVSDRDIVVGFGVGLGALTADASLAVQAAGLGGRRHFGCGLFVPGAPGVM